MLHPDKCSPCRRLLIHDILNLIRLVSRLAAPFFHRYNFISVCGGVHGYSGLHKCLCPLELLIVSILVPFWRISLESQPHKSLIQNECSMVGGVAKVFLNNFNQGLV